MIQEPFTVRLFGPEAGQIRGFLEESGETCGEWSLREEHPEVVVECDDEETVSGLIRRFGSAVFSMTGERFEAVVGAALVGAGMSLATAESCTGGLIGHLITGTPGSSEYYWGGFVTYSNDAKERLLGVPGSLIDEHGAVSEQVVRSMVEGTLSSTGADVAVAVSGIAGPSGGTREKPVGTVWLAAGTKNGVKAMRKNLGGDRDEVKLSSAYHALDMVRHLCIGSTTGE